ncbi:hypothetical protein N658DRAFT_21768 [Parathielavia hyrcaniae]|uniref:Uncharacterized protein n=1 Tax=Parathielavia hyrcaniae TaxID=113614 RepID=A0AAN6T622_9PEZI|nr:hypothetical protein N658DRAFT_21768 [Parathielavia hyrcaniae]
MHGGRMLASWGARGNLSQCSGGLGLAGSELPVIAQAGGAESGSGTAIRQVRQRNTLVPTGSVHLQALVGGGREGRRVRVVMMRMMRILLDCANWSAAFGTTTPPNGPRGMCRVSATLRWGRQWSRTEMWRASSRVENNGVPKREWGPEKWEAILPLVGSLRLTDPESLTTLARFVHLHCIQATGPELPGSV